MKKQRASLLEILLIECVFLFAFFAILKYLNQGNPRLFILGAIILLISYLSIGTARYIEIMKKEEADRNNFTPFFNK